MGGAFLLQLAVASDGLGFYVEPMLGAAGIEGLPVLTNRFSLENGTPGFGFPLRYKITVSDDENFAKSTTIVDHTAADVLNPGDVPISVVVAKKARFVRVTAQNIPTCDALIADE